MECLNKRLPFEITLHIGHFFQNMRQCTQDASQAYSPYVPCTLHLIRQHPFLSTVPNVVDYTWMLLGTQLCQIYKDKSLTCSKSKSSLIHGAMRPNQEDCWNCWRAWITTFALEPSEMEIGINIITLMQHSSKSWDDTSQLEVIHQVANRLGIISPKALVTEKRSL